MELHAVLAARPSPLLARLPNSSLLNSTGRRHPANTFDASFNARESFHISSVVAGRIGLIGPGKDAALESGAVRFGWRGVRPGLEP
jgi:hypothetical protein